MAIALLVGLGNPGSRYADTRHNAGAWLVERFAAAHSATLNPDSKCQGRTARLSINGQDVRLLIPENYMNLSGQSVGAAARFYRIDPASILVAHDELDLAPGSARIKLGGGPGGHNGLKDIISALANDRGFYRLRIGIGHPGHAREVSDYVLGKPPQAERDSIDDAIHQSLAVLPEVIGGDINKAMKTLHTQPKS